MALKSVYEIRNSKMIKTKVTKPISLYGLPKKTCSNGALDNIKTKIDCISIRHANESIILSVRLIKFDFKFIIKKGIKLEIRSENNISLGIVVTSSFRDGVITSVTQARPNEINLVFDE